MVNIESSLSNFLQTVQTDFESLLERANKMLENQSNLKSAREEAESDLSKA